MLSLYIHIPFCVSKCHYCDFNSAGIGRSALPEAEYLAALRREMGRWSGLLGPGAADRFDTVFFGGGTPSLFSAAGIEAVLTEAESLRPRRAGAEVSLELNPKTADLAKMRGFQQAGVNRLSIGVQTLDPGLLAELGRAHDPEEALQALSWGLDAGFEKLSIDLMYGLPKQEMRQLEATLAGLETYPLRHLSAYELIVEEETPFYDRHLRNRLPLPPEPDVEAMRRRVEQFAFAKGMKAYEISNYAAEGAEARHNLHYWNYDSFVGLGSGAVSLLKISELDPGFPSRLGAKAGPEAFALRLTNPRGLAEYQRTARCWDRVEVESISRPQAQGEFMMMGLRKREGVAYADFEACFGEPFPSDFAALVKRGEARGWIEADAAGCRFTEAGLALSNEFLREFF
ncbi:MAG TPA: radical SAM family heme chaperone HemW [bacterium]|nr:radical SAM family heme chaperone HemW [bacterium]